MRAAFFSLGEALVDAITVRLVGDDENAALGHPADAARRNAQAKNADMDRMLHRSMRALLPFDNPKTLIMGSSKNSAQS